MKILFLCPGIVAPENDSESQFDNFEVGSTVALNQSVFRQTQLGH